MALNVALICDFCGSSYVRLASQVEHRERIGKPMRFCSQRCHYANTKESHAVYRICTSCGKKFKTRPSRDRWNERNGFVQQYLCSRACIGGNGNVTDGFKQCKGCGSLKPLTDFHRNATGIGGRRSRCKSCLNELIRESGRRYRQTDHGRSVMRDLVKQWRNRNIEKSRRWARDRARSRAVGHSFESKAYADILRRDPCSYCGKLVPVIHIDHIVPISQGGTSEIHNLTAACQSCNGRKEAHSLLAFLWMGV